MPLCQTQRFLGQLHNDNASLSSKPPVDLDAACAENTMHPHYLTTLFKPRSIAVFGASERPGTVGAVLVENILQAGFRGPIYPVNPRYQTIQGIRAHASIEELDAPVDLAVIATPASTVPEVMDAVGRHGTRAAVVLSAGFREIGEQGSRLESELLAIARQHAIRFLGPNCLGAIRPDTGLNATVSKRGAEPGDLALVAQSGALCTAVLDWAATNAIGFSSVISTGNSADLDFGEILEFLVADPRTKSILLHIEGIHNARRFMSGLRSAARVKPVIVMKTGRHMEGWRAVRSHSGALVGDDDAFDAAFCRAGAVRVSNFAKLFGAAKTLSTGVRTQGDRLAIVTNGGGTGVMAADRLADRGLPVVRLAAETIEALNRDLPTAWSHDNPVDIMGDAPPERFRRAISICMCDGGVDAVLAILTPQAMTEPEAVANALVELAKHHRKPLLTCWMGEQQVESSRRLFSEHAIPSYRTPEAAVDAFHSLATFHQNQLLLLQVPDPMVEEAKPALEEARAELDKALAEGRLVLNGRDSIAVLRAFHIPFTEVYPGSGVSVRSLRLGIFQAPVFGPTIFIAPGGAAAEVCPERVVALPPLNRYLARSLIRTSRVNRLLSPSGSRPPAKAAALETLLLRVSEMACALRTLEKIALDVGIDDVQAVVVDCRIALKVTPDSREPYDHVAIHPYPTELITTWQAPGGEEVTIRPIRPEDAVIEREFVQALSSRSKYFRFMYALEKLTPAMLSRFTQIDYDREMALIAVTKANGKPKEIGVSRYIINPDGETCEFAIVVSDQWQRRGIASQLMLSLIDTARRKGLKVMEGEVLRENQDMLRFMRKLGFEVHASPEDRDIMIAARAL